MTSREELRAIFGAPMERAVLKEHASLDVHSRAFIASAPFLLLATSGAAGRCDVSPKGDAPGFVLVLDDHHLVVPDRPGNNRIDVFSNIVENPHVGMIFLIPGREDTLRVNGRACIVRDGEILDRLEVQGKRPKVAIGVEVEECFLHCAKAFKRSGLWERERSGPTWPGCPRWRACCGTRSRPSRPGTPASRTTSATSRSACGRRSIDLTAR